MPKKGAWRSGPQLDSSESQPLRPVRMEALKFTRDHLWVRVDGGHATIGFSDHGQGELGAIHAVDLPAVGDRIEKGEAFGELESNRTVTDLVAPVSGVISAVNGDLDASPSLVNEDPHHEGWLVEIDLDDADDLDDLMDAEEYEALVGEA